MVDAGRNTPSLFSSLAAPQCLSLHPSVHLAGLWRESSVGCFGHTGLAVVVCGGLCLGCVAWLKNTQNNMFVMVKLGYI